MPRTTMTLALCAIIALGAGAAGSWLTRSNGGVAVVDLDRVAKELGRDVLMSNDLKANQSSLANQLSAIEKNAVEQLQKMKTDMGDKPTEEDNQKLAQTAQATQIQFNNIQKKAVAAIGQRRDVLVANFREEARPVAEKVALAKGAKTVVTRNEVFFFHDSIDITDAVTLDNQLHIQEGTMPSALAPTA